MGNLRQWVLGAAGGEPIDVGEERKNKLKTRIDNHEVLEMCRCGSDMEKRWTRPFQYWLVCPLRHWWNCVFHESPIFIDFEDEYKRIERMLNAPR